MQRKAIGFRLDFLNQIGKTTTSVDGGGRGGGGGGRANRRIIEGVKNMEIFCARDFVAYKRDE